MYNQAAAKVTVSHQITGDANDVAVFHMMLWSGIHQSRSSRVARRPNWNAGTAKGTVGMRVEPRIYTGCMEGVLAWWQLADIVSIQER